MAQKKLMLLGGLRYLLPVIEAAHQQGYYVITADYLPNNIAHKYSDEYCNVSIIDKEVVLAKARELQINGIMSFACDPGVVAASYVQNQMGLPSFGPYESVEILQNKDKFRKFLAENDFNTPWAFGFSDKQEAISSADKFTYPLIVKPTDAAGSKGVTRVDGANSLSDAIDYAFAHSLKGNIIIEEFIDKDGCSSDSDCFSLNGELKVVTFSAQRFDENAAGVFTPAAFSWPSTMSMQICSKLRDEIQRLLTLLQMRTSVYNVETRVGKNGKPYIMEVSPRGGGNRLAEMVRYSTGVDMITACVRAAVGDEIGEIDQKPLNGHWAEIILHADKKGTFQGLQIDPSLSANVVEEDLWVKPGERVHDFEAANDAIGTLVLRFESQEDLENAIGNQRKCLKVIVE